MYIEKTSDGCFNIMGIPDRTFLRIIQALKKGKELNLPKQMEKEYNAVHRRKPDLRTNG